MIGLDTVARSMINRVERTLCDVPHSFKIILLRSDKDAKEGAIEIFGDVEGVDGSESVGFLGGKFEDVNDGVLVVDVS